MGACLSSLNLFLYHPSPCSSSSLWTFLLLLEHNDHFPDSALPVARKGPFSPLAIADSLSTFRIQLTGTSSDASTITSSCLFPLGSEVKWSEVKVTQSCLTLFDPIDYSVHGILQARILERVAVPFSRGSSQPKDQTWVSLIVGRCFTILAIWAREALHKNWIHAIFTS